MIHTHTPAVSVSCTPKKQYRQKENCESGSRKGQSFKFKLWGVYQHPLKHSVYTGTLSLLYKSTHNSIYNTANIYNTLDRLHVDYITHIKTISYQKIKQ
jgi:hypothetical protein